MSRRPSAGLGLIVLGLASQALASLALASPALADAATPLTGVWARGDGITHVRIAPCGPDFCATNIWVKPGRKTEAVGDVLVMSVKPKSPARYAGTAFDPRRKLTMSIELDVQKETFQSRGCLLGGLVCKSVDWTRLD